MNTLDKLKSVLPKRFGSGARQLKREELTEIITAENPNIDSHESMLLTNILGLEDIASSDVMVPRADIISVDINDGIEANIRTIIEANHSRVPVVKGSLDEVLGFLHIKDVARHIAEKKKPNIKSLLRQPIFIAPTMRALDLLQEMRLKRLHLALVIDEYGGIDGLITIEDLVEEIVGEINDEHDKDIAPIIEHNSDGTITAEARVEVSNIEPFVGELLEADERDEIDTIGGLVVTLAGRVPGRGEIIRHPKGVEFEILESHPRHIARVRICRFGKLSASASR